MEVIKVNPAAPSGEETANVPPSYDQTPAGPAVSYSPATSQPQYTAQPASVHVVTTVQPTAHHLKKGQLVQQQEAVNDYMGLSVFTCLCCCWPLGLIAIMQSNKSRGLAEQGYYEEATTASKLALGLNIAGIIGGIAIIGLIIATRIL